MKLLRALTNRPRGPTVEWGGSALAFSLAFALRFALEGSLPPGYPFLTFFPLVFLVGFFLSTRAGILTALVSGGVAYAFFVTPGGLRAPSGPDLVAMTFYGFIVATGLLLIHLMRVALRKLDLERAASAQMAEQNRLMFHELQHRVSNNLQVIGAILRMEERKMRDPEGRQALRAAASRLGVIAAVQRQLHDPARQVTEIGALMRATLPEIVAGATLQDRVRLEFDLEPLPVPADQASPVALIAVEMVSNALEHALPACGRLTVTLRTRVAGGMAELDILDDGRGLPEGFDATAASSLGLRLAQQFSAQLNGTLEFSRREGGGTRVALRFPLGVAG
ncbi:sensor histidine kinase [Rhodobacter capsulatus]|uniref:sensor histidine kinase n=1 Tax=Rhodobacter capsulatus TaxID=1061 RepID=UPI0003D38CE1|nr:ATP-binding protein [Rhodobacter capsulatus]ETD81405.1 histidine kinase [Rhodobacter capsulatus YW1]ETD89188.1 histidine kinase [Rhodobacter capsulatus YW2]